MMGMDMSNHPASRTKDFFASPALSLSLAGVFRGAAPSASEVVEQGDEGSGGGVGEEVADISSGNTGPMSDDDADGEGLPEEEEEEEVKKKRKRYHRHTSEQIRVMEALFKESPHPDEKQRQQLSKQLGLAPRQIKFWFQNRRTQIKAIQERHENSLLKSEIDKLREDNQCMREAIKKSCCPNCGFATTTRDTTMTSDEQQLRIENARLKAEIEKLRAAAGKFPGGTTSPTSSCSAGNDPDNRNTLDYYTGLFGIDKSKILEIVDAASNELMKMGTAGEPLWIRSVETGREILNYDEYVQEFSPDNSSSGGGVVRQSIEASRETGVVFLDASRLVQAFMDVNKWKEMFPCMVSKAATIDVIRHGEGDTRNGAIQLMFAEIQMLTPMVPTREVYFIRQCKQLSSDSWAIIDVSIDGIQENNDASPIRRCRKRPSGCIIQDQCSGHCKVIWVEHLECKRSTVHTLYRSIVNSGLAFGAKHWMATLQVQCERLVFFMATNVPTKDSSGVTTLAGRKSILKLAQRMSSNFYRAIAASSYHTWTKISTKGGDDIKVASRKNLNEPGEPVGLILCAVSSVWLPVSPLALFDFLRDESRRNEWDIISTGGTMQPIANLAKGQGRGNSVTLHAAKSKETNMWILQDSCTNAFESSIVFAPININEMQSVMTGCDSSNVPVLPSGFSILLDGLETRPLVITSRPEERATEGGSLLTLAFQILANVSPSAKLTMESVENVNTLISCTLEKIKTSLKCEDG